MSASALVHVVAAVIFDGDLVLAARRRPERVAGGLWEFPGGKVETGESLEGALRREIREELGVDIQVADLLLTVDRPALGIRLSCLRSALRGAPPVHSSDHDELRWVRPQDIDLDKWAEPDRPVIGLLLGASGLN